AKKISGNSCGRTGCRTEFSNPSTISSIIAATLGTRSSISRGKSCPSPAAIGQPQVTQSEDWYKGIAAPMPQHVRMDRELHLGSSAGGQLRALNGLRTEALATLPLASMPVR